MLIPSFLLFLGLFQLIDFYSGYGPHFSASRHFFTESYLIYCKAFIVFLNGGLRFFFPGRLFT